MMSDRLLSEAKVLAEVHAVFGGEHRGDHLDRRIRAIPTAEPTTGRDERLDPIGPGSTKRDVYGHRAQHTAPSCIIHGDVWCTCKSPFRDPSKVDVKHAAPEPDVAEFADLLRELDGISTPSADMRWRAAAALRKVLWEKQEAERLAKENDAKSLVHEMANENLIRERREWETKRAQLQERIAYLEPRLDEVHARAERAEADLAREREAHEETRKRLAWADDDKHVIADERDAARAEVERLKSELDAADKKWRGYERDYILPAFEWATNFGIDLEKAVREDNKAGRNCVAILVHTMQAEVDRLRAQLADTERALDQAGMRNIERAAAEPVRWDDVEGLGRILYMSEGGDSYSWEHGGPEWKARYSERGTRVASALARSLLTDGAVSAAANVEEPEGSEYSAEAWHRAAMRAALTHAGANVEAEPVAEGRACPWDDRRDNIRAAIRMVHQANEPHSSAIHGVTIALEQLALAVDEVRRLGGGGK